MCTSYVKEEDNRKEGSVTVRLHTKFHWKVKGRSSVNGKGSWRRQNLTVIEKLESGWLVASVKHVTPRHEVLHSSPTLGAEQVNNNNNNKRRGIEWMMWPYFGNKYNNKRNLAWKELGFLEYRNGWDCFKVCLCVCVYTGTYMFTDIVVYRVMVPQSCLHPNPRTYEYITFHSEDTLQMRFKILR